MMELLARWTDMLAGEPSRGDSTSREWVDNNYHKLDRAGHVILFRLHTGQNQLNADRYMKLVSSPMCTCNIEDHTSEHILYSEGIEEKC